MSWDEVSLVVVVFLVLPLMNMVYHQRIESFADGDAWSYDKKSINEAGILQVVTLVQVIIQDEHGHDNCLTRTCSHLESSTRQNVLRVF